MFPLLAGVGASQSRAVHPQLLRAVDPCDVVFCYVLIHAVCPFLVQPFTLLYAVPARCIVQCWRFGLVAFDFLASGLTAPSVLLHSFRPLRVVLSGSGCFPFALPSPTA